MDVSEIYDGINRARWFEGVGSYSPRNGVLAISTLRAWNRAVFPEDLDEYHASIAEKMDWLPSRIDDIDPIHGESLVARVRALEIDYRPIVLDLYRCTLKSMRNVDVKKFALGGHDYSVPAFHAGAYCVRAAAMECMLREPGFWCDLFAIFVEGYWPCGLLPGRIVVVF